MGRETSDLKKRTGAELRAAAAERAAAAADPVEQARRVLAAHEHVIENAVRKFVEMGRSLLAIRSERLYSGEYSTFAEYCDARWEISETYANRVINASLVAIKATPIGVEINSEAVARELADLVDKPEQLRQVWDEATRRAAGGRVTATLIKDVRKAFDPPPPAALEGEVIDPPTDGPYADDAAEAFINNQTDPETNASDSDVSGSAAGVDVADPPTPAAPQTHPDAIPGEAEDEGPEGGESSGVDDVGTSATQTELERSAPVDPSGSVDGRERPEVPGVSAPAALDPDGADLQKFTGLAEAQCEYIYPHEPHNYRDEDERGVAYAFACPGVPLPHPVALIEAFAEQYERLDVDALGPTLSSAELVRIRKAVGRLQRVAELLETWNERATQ